MFKTYEFFLEHPTSPAVMAYLFLKGEMVLARLGEVYAVCFDASNIALDDQMKIAKRRQASKPTSWWGPMSVLQRTLDLKQTPTQLQPLMNSTTQMNALFGNISFVRFAVDANKVNGLSHMTSEKGTMQIVHTFSFYGNKYAFQAEQMSSWWLRMLRPQGFGIIGITSGNISGEPVATTPPEALELAQQMGIRYVFHRHTPAQIGQSYLITDMTEFPPQVFRERQPGEGKKLVEQIKEKAAILAPV